MKIKEEITTRRDTLFVKHPDTHSTGKKKKKKEWSVRESESVCVCVWERAIPFINPWM